MSENLLEEIKKILQKFNDELDAYHYRLNRIEERLKILENEHKKS